jgi:cation diffusion facilitator family transporter
VISAILFNLLLAVVKTILAASSDSIAITASVIDSITDTFASVAVYIGFRLSTKSSKSFPLGLYKIENLISVIIAFFILISGYEIGRSALLNQDYTEPTISLFTLIVLGVLTLGTHLFSRYVYHIGRKTESPTLIAEGKHRQVDFLSSFVVFISAILGYFDIKFAAGWVTIDRIAAIGVLIFVFRAGWQLLYDGLRVLLDASIDSPTLENIRKIIEAEPAVAEIPSLLGRSAGRFRFIQCSITLNISDLEKAHSMSDRIETKIRDTIPHVEKVVIHYEPVRKTTEIIAIPLADDQETPISHIGEAGSFLVCRLNTNSNQIESSEILPNPHRDDKKRKGLRVADLDNIDQVSPWIRDNVVKRNP